MAKSSGLGDNFYIGGYDLSGDVASVDTVSGARDVLEVTAIKQLAFQRLYGLANGAWQFTTYFENTPTISTPGVPSSGSPVTNTYNVTVYVTITGGTISNVLVNGSSVGTTDGTYPVPAGQTISITYSVAPTWNWFALGAEHTVLSSFPSADTVACYFRGAAVGNAAAAINAKQTDYAFTRDTSGNLTAQVTIGGNGYGMEWGVELTPGIQTINTTGSGTVYDAGASAPTAFGAQAYLQIIAFVGTSIDIAVQSSTTSGGTYTTVSGLDFGSQSAIGSFRAASTGFPLSTTTINEFVKWTATGTFSYCEFALMVCRNTVAGPVY